MLVVLLPARRGNATIEEQRARLPPPAHCEDPVAGIWKSHAFHPAFDAWYIFTLTIRHKAGGQPGELEGSIQAHAWRGAPQDQEPPQCSMGLDHWTIQMTAVGSHQPDGHIMFGGTSWRPENVYCGRGPGPGEYNLDQFSGVIDPAIQEFQSVNNDGGAAVNEPTVFRRISCGESPQSANIQPVAPPFYPQRGGCGCDF